MGAWLMPALPLAALTCRTIAGCFYTTFKQKFVLQIHPLPLKQTKARATSSPCSKKSPEKGSSEHPFQTPSHRDSFKQMGLEV